MLNAIRGTAPRIRGIRNVSEDKPLDNGRLVNGIEFYGLLRDPSILRRVLTNPQLNDSVSAPYCLERLRQGAKGLLLNQFVRSRTVLVKSEDGKLKRIYASSHSGLGIEVVVPKLVLERYGKGDSQGRGLVFNMAPENSRITIGEHNTSAIIELLDPNSAVVLMLAESGTWGRASDATLGVPVKSDPENPPACAKYAYLPKGECAGIICRTLKDFWPYTCRHVIVDTPALKTGVLVI